MHYVLGRQNISILKCSMHLIISLHSNILTIFCSSSNMLFSLFEEVHMRMIIAAVLVLWFGGVALAVVGGGDIIMKNEGGETVFSHDRHVNSAGLTCKDCHAAPYLNTKNHVVVTMQEMGQGKSCGACHNGTKAFGVNENCETCHAQEKVKQGGKQ